VTPAQPGGVPEWLSRLASRAGNLNPPSRMQAPASGGRPSAVLLLFGETNGEADLLIVQRSPYLRRHAGQPAFPGGATEPAGVEVLAVLPELFIPRSGFRVTPVLAWWRVPSPLLPASDGEIVSAVRARLDDLADPANRLTVRLPNGVTAGPAFRLHGMLVWGFTAALVDRLLALGGWERPWDAGHEEDLPPDVLSAAARG